MTQIRHTNSNHNPFDYSDGSSALAYTFRPVIKTSELQHIATSIPRPGTLKLAQNHTRPLLPPRTIAARYPSELQRRATQNIPAPSIQTFPPDANARPRKRTTYNNIPYTTPSQTQHHPTTTMLAAPPSQTPRSQRYSQRSSNLTKISHDSVGSISIPYLNLPQTAAINDEPILNVCQSSHPLPSLPLPHKTSQQNVHGRHNLLPHILL
jgi:hypothetical protein